MTPARAAWYAAAALAVGLAASACRPADDRSGRIDTAELSRRAARLEEALGRGTVTIRDTSNGLIDTAGSADTTAADRTADDSSEKDEKAGAIARWVLPRDLDEISGIALTADGRLLAHGDERGQISEIDYRRGVIVKQFVVGRPTLRADIEGITVVHGTIFLLTSKGILYEFREGANGSRVEYITSDTRLGKDCEFEGVAYDAHINSLLLACKNVEAKKSRDNMVIYRWRLEGGGERVSRLEVPLSKILPLIDEKEYHPSDITVDPKTGNYLIVAGIEEALVEITPAGEVVFARKLTGEHNQPEAIAITKDDILIIGDEAGRRPAALTLYPWPR